MKFNEKNMDVVLKRMVKLASLWTRRKNKEFFEVLTLVFSKLAENTNGASEQKQPTKYFKR
ncbi:hypothetical protein [Leptotrichia hofstadii]|uniref:hypothetical protein n=1 Tax=Leptotrichia hofstadii TaxID=157688 RepID=UPI0015628198|nr:hypothetical protein [Leptotrichia hofstadii]